MPLTDAACKAVKPNGQKQELADARGLFLVIGVSGRKSWVLRFKDGRQSRRHTIGYYDPRDENHLSLADARDKAAKIKADLKSGAAEKIILRAASASGSASTGMTVSQAWAEYMKRCWDSDGGDDQDKRKRAKWALFASVVEPAIGAKSLHEVTEDDLTDLLQNKHDAMLAAGHTGRGIGNIHAVLSAFFSWCRRKGRGITKLKTNPMMDVVKIDKAIEGKRAFDDTELPWVLDAFPAAGSFAKPYEMILRSACRKSEIMLLQKHMVVLDSPLGPHLDIPKTKNTLPHIVPLTPSMVALLPDLTDLAQNDFIWRSPRGGGLNSEGVSKSVGRMRKEIERLAREDHHDKPVEHWSLHDFRRSCETFLNGTDPATMQPLVMPHIIDKVTNHQEVSKVRRIYNRHQYHAEKRHALGLWNDHLDRLRLSRRARQNSSPTKNNAE